jgi:hypothetical protein
MRSNKVIKIPQSIQESKNKDQETFDFWLLIGSEEAD